jgi:hypothetical protein
MIETRNVTQNPYQKYRYDAGKTFYLPDNLAKHYIDEGAAMEDKSLDEAPETKKRKKKSS